MLRIPLHQLTDNISECRQWKINFGSFLKPITRGMSLTLSLRPRQIDQVELTCLNPLITLLIFLSSFNINCENRMTARRRQVHCCLARFSHGIAFLHKLFYLRSRFYDARGQVLDVDTFVGIFFQIEFVLNLLGEEIADLLVINFQVGASNQKLFTDVVGVIQITEYVIKWIGNDTSLGVVALYSDHGVGLSATSLAVCKYCTIVPSHDRLN